MRAGVKKHFCPVQKFFAPQRLCVFALKMTASQTSAFDHSSPVNRPRRFHFWDGVPQKYRVGWRLGW
jgi:hypothetical protein